MMRGKRHITAVLFDLGGTLIRTTEIPLVMKEILEHRGINRSLEHIAAAREAAEKELNFRELTNLFEEFWVRWNLRILQNLAIKSERRELAEFIASHWWDYCDVALYPEAAGVLSLLRRQGLKIGVVTNGLQSDVDQILSRVNLQHFFDVVVMIDTLGKMKPDPEVFLYALEKLGTTQSDAIFVGDELEADYEGATGAGLAAYLIDREGRVRDGGVRTISSLEDIFGLRILQP
jgi:putative hydrolase of the HAD superfamily